MKQQNEWAGGCPWRSIVGRLNEIHTSLLVVYFFDESTPEAELSEWFDMRTRESDEIVNLMGAI